MRVRTRLAVVAVGVVFLGIAGSWLSLACPDQAYSVYSGARRSVPGMSMLSDLAGLRIEQEDIY